MRPGTKKHTWATFTAEFWNTYREENGCWIWTGNSRKSSTEKGSRPRCSPPGLRKQVYAYRVSYELTYGPIPDGHFICHRCDNSMCIRPEHLFTGTQADNLADMKRKDRSSRGERRWCARLTADNVRAIRTAYAAGGITQRALAQRFGVHRITVVDVVTRRKWKHI